MGDLKKKTEIYRDWLSYCLIWQLLLFDGFWSRTWSCIIETNRKNNGRMNCPLLQSQLMHLGAFLSSRVRKTRIISMKINSDVHWLESIWNDSQKLIQIHRRVATHEVLIICNKLTNQLELADIEISPQNICNTYNVMSNVKPSNRFLLLWLVFPKIIRSTIHWNFERHTISKRKRNIWKHWSEKAEKTYLQSGKCISIESESVHELKSNLKLIIENYGKN